MPINGHAGFRASVIDCLTRPKRQIKYSTSSWEKTQLLALVLVGAFNLVDVYYIRGGPSKLVASKCDAHLREGLEERSGQLQRVSLTLLPWKIMEQSS